jgi:uncharacterized protein YciU (UPF0263 family)
MSTMPAEVEYFRGFNPVLLVFAPERTHPAHVAAREVLRAAAEELSAWEIVLFTVFSSGAVFRNGERLEGADATRYRRDFGVHRERFAAVLLGLQGTQEQRQDGALSLPEIFDTLKAMRGRALRAESDRQARMPRG